MGKPAMSLFMKFTRITMLMLAGSLLATSLSYAGDDTSTESESEFSAPLYPGG